MEIRNKLKNFLINGLARCVLAFYFLLSVLMIVCIALVFFFFIILILAAIVSHWFVFVGIFLLALLFIAWEYKSNLINWANNILDKD